MKYFMDTEFHEYKKQPTVCGLKVGKAIPTIELISIGIVSEDDREYYAISKDFDVKAAWNSYQWKTNKPVQYEYWLRDNVLKPIFIELHLKDIGISIKAYDKLKEQVDNLFTYTNFNKLIKKYGKTNKEIAEDIIYFTWKKKLSDNPWEVESRDMPINFYAYYADYNWVVFCWLFGRMIDLPEGFPKYYNDLKQILDEKVNALPDSLDAIKNRSNYPKQENEHNALDNAIFNRKLYEFLNNL